MEGKTFRVDYSDNTEAPAELQSASCWCDQCVVFVDAMKRKITTYTTYEGEVEKLRESSVSGCRMCAMILDRCGPDQTEFWIELTGKAGGDLYMEVRGWSPSRGQHLSFRRQHFGQPPPDQASLHGGEGTGSIWHNMLARNWLSSCQRSHYRCSESRSLTFVPSRLLSLSRATNKVSLQLCNMWGSTDTLGAGSSPGYCTLSHCWGRTQPIKLTRESYESFQENIPFDVLPKTFADAVHISLNLGVHFLWIDSLCICQDDHGDWLAESARMGDIYANGICNIAALDQGACFFGGPTPASDALYFSTRGKYYLATKYAEPTSYDDWLKNTPLGKRGWVFQELVLSRRTIFYGAGGISWNCLDGTADEVHSMRARLPYTRAATGYKRTFARFQSSTALPIQHRERSVHDNLWSQLVSEYTNTVLSHETDKWLAISGLARRYMESSDRRLVADFHYDSLLEELAWWSNTSAGRVLNGAPMWSWLSCKSGVSMFAANPDQMLASMVALPDEHLATRTWHRVYPSLDIATAMIPAKSYSIKISGHMRPFCFSAQKGRFHRSFEAEFETYSMEAETERVWMDVPLTDGTRLWGVPHSWTLPYDPKLSMILLVPASHAQDCWQRVGVCSACAYGFGKWDNPRGRERFLHAFGPVKEMTII